MTGRSAARVSQWIKNKTIHLEPNGRIDPEKARAELERNLDMSKNIDWNVTFAGKKSSDSNPGDDLSKFGLSGNPFRDGAILGLRHFYEDFSKKMIPILLAMFGKLKVSKTSAKVLTVCLLTKMADEIEEYVRRDSFNDQIKALANESLDSLWAGFARHCRKTSVPKNFEIPIPEAVMKLVDKEMRKQFGKMALQEKKGKGKP